MNINNLNISDLPAEIMTNILENSKDSNFVCTEWQGIIKYLLDKDFMACKQSNSLQARVKLLDNNHTNHELLKLFFGLKIDAERFDISIERNYSIEYLEGVNKKIKNRNLINLFKSLSLHPLISVIPNILDILSLHNPKISNAKLNWKNQEDQPWMILHDKYRVSHDENDSDIATALQNWMNNNRNVIEEIRNLGISNLNKLIAEIQLELFEVI